MPQKEIDLIDLSKTISNKIGLLATSTANFLIRNFIGIIIFISTGVAIGFIQYSFFNNNITYKTIIKSNSLTSTELVNDINNINFSTMCDSLTNAKINSIKAGFLHDINKDGQWDIIEDGEKIDTSMLKTRMNYYLCISCNVNDTSVINHVNSTLIKHIKQLPRIKKHHELKLQQYNEMNLVINKEINDLDSLKQKQYFSDKNSYSAKNNELFVIQENETKLFHNDIIALAKTKQNIERSLILSKEPIESINIIMNQKESLYSLIFRYAKFMALISILFFFMYEKRNKLKDKNKFKELSNNDKSRSNKSYNTLERNLEKNKSKKEHSTLY